MYAQSSLAENLLNMGLIDLKTGDITSLAKVKWPWC